MGGGTFGRPGGGGPRGGPGGRGGPDAGATNHRYALTFSVNARNVFNNVNLARPSAIWVRLSLVSPTASRQTLQRLHLESPS